MASLRSKIVRWCRAAGFRRHVTVDAGADVSRDALLDAWHGEILVERGARIAAGAVVNAQGGTVRIGADSALMHYAVVYGAGGVTIGNHVLVGNHCLLSSVDHTWSGPEWVDLQPMRSAPVVIEDGAWIGAYTAVMAGVTIGEGSIVGSHSLVREDVPPYAVVAGTPARLIRHRER